MNIQHACVVSDHSVWSLIGPVRWVITCVVTEQSCAVVCGHQTLLCSEWSWCAVTKWPCVVSDHLVWSPISPVNWAITLCDHRTVLCSGVRSPNSLVLWLFTICRHWMALCISDHLVQTVWWLHTVIIHRTGQFDQWPHGQFGDHTGQFGNHTRWSLTAQGCSVTAHCDHSLHRRVWWLHTVITHHTGLFDDRTRWSLTAQVRLLTAQGDHCTGPFGDRTLWLLTAHACHIFVNSEIPHIEISDCVAKVKVKFNVKCNALFDTTGLPRESDWWNTT